MTISFNEWLETKVTDAKHILPEAKIAFMQMYLKEKEMELCRKITMNSLMNLKNG